MTLTIRTIGIQGLGGMSATVARECVARGFRVMTCLEGRSGRSANLAAASGLEIAESLDALVEAADLVLSFVSSDTEFVPGHAELPFVNLRDFGEVSRSDPWEVNRSDFPSVRRRMDRRSVDTFTLPRDVGFALDVAAAMRRTGSRPAFADCERISQYDVGYVARRLAQAGGVFISAVIVDNPAPGAALLPVRLYCSGPDTSALEALDGPNLIVRRLGDEHARAAVLRRVYPSMADGFAALASPESGRFSWLPYFCLADNAAYDCGFPEAYYDAKEIARALHFPPETNVDELISLREAHHRENERARRHR